jgi:Sulfotransferase family
VAGVPPFSAVDTRRARAAVMVKVRALPVARNYPGTYLAATTLGRRLRSDAESLRSTVVFVGHPRSGHSLVGALLDAHPDVVVAHEADLLKYVAAGFGRDQLIALLVRRERERVEAGHVSGSGYTYAVPDQWQGRYRRLTVVGDKKGGRSTLRLADDPDLLDRLAAATGVPVRAVQVVRNPWDNIATMASRAPRRSLADHVDLYFEMAGTVDAVRAAVPAERFHTLCHEDLVADPRGTVAALCRYLDVPVEPDHLSACASVVFPVPRRTRDGVDWPDDVQRSVVERAARHPWLDAYRVGEDGP